MHTGVSLGAATQRQGLAAAARVAVRHRAGGGPALHPQRVPGAQLPAVRTLTLTPAPIRALALASPSRNPSPSPNPNPNPDPVALTLTLTPTRGPVSSCSTATSSPTTWASAPTAAWCANPLTRPTSNLMCLALSRNPRVKLRPRLLKPSRPSLTVGLLRDPDTDPAFLPHPHPTLDHPRLCQALFDFGLAKLVRIQSGVTAHKLTGQTGAPSPNYHLPATPPTPPAHPSQPTPPPQRHPRAYPAARCPLRSHRAPPLLACVRRDTLHGARGAPARSHTCGKGGARSAPAAG